MKKLKILVESKMKLLEEYGNQSSFDLYNLEEKIFQESQKIAKEILSTITNKHLSQKKMSINTLNALSVLHEPS